MQYIPITSAKNLLLNLVRKIKDSDNTIAITRNGVPEAVLISMKRFEGLLQTSDVLTNNFSGTEKRQCVRLDKNFVISYKRELGSDGYDITSINNISKGGLFFISHVNYPIGTALELIITFPFRKGKDRAKIISKVVNVIKKGKFYGIGVQFIRMNKTVLAEFHSFIDNIKKKSTVRQVRP